MPKRKANPNHNYEQGELILDELQPHVVRAREELLKLGFKLIISTDRDDKFIVEALEIPRRIGKSPV